MNRVFIISDTHFGHKRICEFEPKHRPFASTEEHDEELVRRWNNVVNPNDTVWHLGDVLFGLETFEILGRLNGSKKLVMGNHDQYPIAKYAEHFTTIAACVKLRGCILTHMPVHPNQLTRYKANIHGHMHALSMLDDRYINVSVEQTNLTPALLDTVLQNVVEKI